MTTINRKNLVTDISQELALNQMLVDDIVISLFEQIKKQYQQGKRIEIRGFGTFNPSHRNARCYVNPVTSKKEKTPAKTILKFKCSKQLYK